jgi:ribosomal protein S8E
MAHTRMATGRGCAHTAKQWKRMVTKVTFVGEGFTRKVPHLETEKDARGWC